METNFWLERWETKQTSFHRSEANEALVAHFQKLALEKGARVFVPLCGKSTDMHWLYQQGYHIIGVDISDIAIDAFFREHGLQPARVAVDDTIQRSSRWLQVPSTNVPPESNNQLRICSCLASQPIICNPEDFTSPPTLTVNLRLI